VISTIGTVVKQGILNYGNNELDLSALPAGYYFVGCKNKEGQAIGLPQRLVKL
jgi:hypothetical protein